MELLLFQESKEEKLEREISDLRKELGNIRRGLFARHSELERKYQETYFELETLKSSIARQDISIWTSRSSISTQSKKKQESSQELFMFT